MNMSKELMAKVIGDSYENTILEIADDAMKRIQSNTSYKEYVEKQSELVSLCIAELKRRKGF